MDTVLLLRIHFTITICFHYIFPQLTIGLSWLIVWMMTRYLRTGEIVYRVMARFWIRLFSMMFVLGVASGITMEFQFGTNWASYSRFVGDIFGAPLAAEVIFAFFLESTFLSLLVYGEKRLSPWMHWFSSVMVAFGATFSAFWIVVANSWMQTPAGYHIVNGRAELTDFSSVVFNPSTIPRFLHVIDGALISGSFFMLGISALYLFRRKHIEFAKKSLKSALIVAFAASILQLPLGHYHTVQVAETQPEKLAVFEGLFDTTARAPLLLFGIPNSDKGRTDYAFGLPGFLSFLVSGSFDTEVQGLNDFPSDEWPPIFLPFVSFHVMVALGFYFIGLTCLGMVLLWKNRLYGNSLFLKAAIYSIPLPIIANEIGWIAAEVGRQPWIVYRVMRTKDAISTSVSAGEVLFSCIMFTIIYILLFCIWIFLLKRALKDGPEPLMLTGNREAKP